MTTIVRPIRDTDRAEWLRMRHVLWPEGTADEHAAEIADYLNGRPPTESGLLLASAVFVAERASGGLCGLLEASIRTCAEGCETNRVGYVEGWFVDPDVRRSGIGKQLVAAAEAWATERGCREMASDAYVENTVSRDAHRALGFTESCRLAHFSKTLSGPTSADRTNEHRLTLLALAGTFAVCKLPVGCAIPEWATTAKGLFSITRTADELSIVCAEAAVPEDVQCERDRRCLRVAGAMPFALVGVLAVLTAPLASAGVSVFAVSTFDTDYLLLKARDFENAIRALRAAGHVVEARAGE
ncbi:aminoglycoside acetyltransferase : Sortase-like acyltransferase OS=Singulisphaera acidiphila (strain ATCC BAA-1392 / DSM 18658 / VKM B-2454 / MOB10) GN=Sinac_6048 PE=4 SV=1: Acetyltransf_1: ACT_7 [Gemmata massiliana]|uniref:N-acetyltransferase domain-containing protein n=1 Tax=Gemmata massiliana TaxID=1210884 RepID=A0A6P2DDM1_9BACT|nr:GNAT family N-acetyltransferase [Gemmata massiliana]VTR97660.1 aminoglycoside acetyltransferase : Sortase-like acyltransferase OS=Singulisphaera acidiphila (strain ATCC BAA-1392 / DSM 18658 / VKM B-2454 / MOB10) GN=Sinac_6048 PE=4 SV=1: Acetyltransf_1: ACT_7 [Gemmata massiliana]